MKTIMLAATLFSFGTAAAMAAANPASVFCEEIGGKSENATLADGSEIGLCVFGNGNMIEEWTLFRMLTGDRESDENR